MLSATLITAESEEAKSVEPGALCSEPDIGSGRCLGGEGSEEETEEGHGQEGMGGLGEEADWCLGGVRPAEEAEDGQGQEGMGGLDNSSEVDKQRFDEVEGITMWCAGGVAMYGAE